MHCTSGSLPPLNQAEIALQTVHRARVCANGSLRCIAHVCVLMPNAALRAGRYFADRLAFPSTEHGWSLEHESPITPTAWISISIPGRAKFVTVMSALPG